jgi:predicted GIY-YIG superfamily endonuclease
VPKLLYLIDCDPGVPAGVDGGPPVNRQPVNRREVIWWAGKLLFEGGLKPSLKTVQRTIRSTTDNGKAFRASEIQDVLRTADWNNVSSYTAAHGESFVLPLREVASIRTVTRRAETVADESYIKKWHRVQRSEIKSFAGVYAVFNATRKLLYIGSSLNLQNRLKPNHHILAISDSECEIRVRYCAAGLHLLREFLLIRRLRPTMNRTNVNAR